MQRLDPKIMSTLMNSLQSPPQTEIQTFEDSSDFIIHVYINMSKPALKNCRPSIFKVEKNKDCMSKNRTRLMGTPNFKDIHKEK